MNITATTRSAIVAVAIITAFSGVTACGADVSPPSQDINKVVKKQAPAQPQRTTGNRLKFGDDLGNAETRAHKSSPAGSGTRNRLDFRDTGR